MNERIDLLALEATDNKGGLDRHKFAELIIRQCSEICLSNQFDGAEHYNNGSVSCSELIKHRFGIQ